MHAHRSPLRSDSNPFPRTRLRSAFAPCALAFLLLIVLAPPVAAQKAPGEAGAVDEAWAYDVWHDTMSPYCPGRTLAECPSPQADQLRRWILDQAEAGTSRETVQEMLFERFGSQVLTAPRAEGWGLAAWMIPILGGVVGVGLLVWVLRRMVSSPGGEPEADLAKEPIDPELLRRIEEESQA
jgi:cytochrome c-type biogenesis protein CcmH/NrfF